MVKAAAVGSGKDEVQNELGDVPPEEFRAQLHKVADWIADYRAHIEQRPISPDILPGQITAQLPAAPPAQPENIDTIFADFEQLIVPNLVHWGHPAFLGYFGSTTNAPGIYGEMLAAALNVSAMTWRTSPAATELEIVVLDWIRQMIELPQEFEGIVYDTASVGIMHALAAARESLNLNIRREGLGGRNGTVPCLRIYASDQAHSSIEKAAIALGIGEANVRRIASDENYCLKIEELRAAIEEDVRAGFHPTAVVATVGTTSATSVDPVREIAAVCREHHLWLHVDAAYGAALALLPEGRWVMDGVAEADSVIVNPHKWLFVPLDFSVLYTKRLDVLRATFSLTPEYLQGDAAAGSNQEEKAAHAQRNYMDYGIQLGRRFRALKAWMVFRTFGSEGLRARIREHCRLARLFASWVEADADFEVLAPVKMAVVCFRARTKGYVTNWQLNELNQTLIERVNATGEAYLTHTRLHGKVVARLAVGNVLTTEHHLSQTWKLIRRELAGLCKKAEQL